MSNIFTCIVWAVVIFFIFKWIIDVDASNAEGFGRDDKPFDPDNSISMQNPWDNIDYIVPRFVM